MMKVTLETRRAAWRHVRITDVLDCVDGWCRDAVEG